MFLGISGVKRYVDRLYELYDCGVSSQVLSKVAKTVETDSLHNFCEDKVDGKILRNFAVRMPFKKKKYRLFFHPQLKNGEVLARRDTLSTNLSPRLTLLVMKHQQSM